MQEINTYCAHSDLPKARPVLRLASRGPVMHGYWVAHKSETCKVEFAMQSRQVPGYDFKWRGAIVNSVMNIGGPLPIRCGHYARSSHRATLPSGRASYVQYGLQEAKPLCDWC